MAPTVTIFDSFPLLPFFGFADVVLESGFFLTIVCDGLDSLFLLIGFVAITFGCGGGAGLSKRGDCRRGLGSGGFSSSLRDCLLGALCLLGEASLASFSSGVIEIVPSADTDPCFFLAGERISMAESMAGASDVMARRLERRAGVAGGAGEVVMVGNRRRFGWYNCCNLEVTISNEVTD